LSNYEDLDVTAVKGEVDALATNIDRVLRTSVTHLDAFRQRYGNYESADFDQCQATGKLLRRSLVNASLELKEHVTIHDIKQVMANVHGALTQAQAS
jgi:hypothetical protein